MAVLDPLGGQIWAGRGPPRPPGPCFGTPRVYGTPPGGLFWTPGTPVLDPPGPRKWGPKPVRTPQKWGYPRFPDPPGIGIGGPRGLLYQGKGVPISIPRAVFSKKYIKPSRLGGFWGSFLPTRPSKSGQFLRARAGQRPVLDPRTGLYSRCNMDFWTPQTEAPGLGGSKTRFWGGSGPLFWGPGRVPNPHITDPPKGGVKTTPRPPLEGGSGPLFWGPGVGFDASGAIF